MVTSILIRFGSCEGGTCRGSPTGVKTLYRSDAAYCQLLRRKRNDSVEQARSCGKIVCSSILTVRGSNATGSPQTDRGDMPQRLKHGREEKYSRGLDNSGNREGSTTPLFRLAPSAARLRRQPLPARGGRLPQQRTARRGAAERRLDRRRRMGYGRASGVSRGRGPRDHRFADAEGCLS